MVVAINDISFLWGFHSKYNAKEALVRFGNVALGLKDEKVSKVDAKIDIINSDLVHANTILAPEYKLINALNDIKEENREQFLLILQILTQCGGDEIGEDEITIGKFSSKHCARYRDKFLISIVSNKIFENDIIECCLNQKDKCRIRNIANEDDKYTYWEELGFREYELNEKHGDRIYIRCGGKAVSIAPETDELGQKLLNHAVEVKGRLFSVDHEENNRIFEFRHSYANVFHGFLQEDIPRDLVNKILKADTEKWN